MAIPSIPQNFYLQQGNTEVYASWDLVSGATSYDVQRSTDGITYASVSTPSAPSYLDTSVTLGTQYFYKIASVNSSGTSPYTSPQSAVPAPNAELSLGELRERCKQRADRVNSDFVTLPEWNFFINQAMYELYDLLITTYDDYFEAPEVSFATNGTSFLYPLPNGVLTFTNPAGSTVVAEPFYKLLGVDLSINCANNAYVTMEKYNLIDRNRYLYPNSSGSIYGVFNMRYRVMGTNIRFIPTPSSGQYIRLLYAPRLPTLLRDTDLTTIGFSGWLQYVIVRAAKYALDKEESDTTKLDQELAYLKGRIEETAANRDAGIADTISDTRQNDPWGNGKGWSGPIGGWALLPGLATHTTSHNIWLSIAGAALSALFYCLFRKKEAR